MTTRHRPAAAAVVAGLLLGACAAPSTSSPESAPTEPAATAAPPDQTSAAAAATPDAIDPSGAASPTAEPPPATTPATTQVTAATTVPTPATAAAPTPCELPLTTIEKVALLVWPSVYSSDWSTARATVSEHQLGGVLLMKPSGWDAGTLRQRLGELEQESTHGLIVATDEEGGDVQRLGELWPLASQFDVSTTMSPAEAGQLIAVHAALVADVGIDVVLGPVVDVLPSQGAPPLQRSRFFAGSPGEVSDYAAAYVGAWQQAGIEPVLKHFPGHGDASGDTHVGEGITAPLAELEQRDLVPYRALAASGAGVMIGHLETPGLTGDAPASRSERAIDYLRNQLGFGDGLIVSDSLDMDAVGVPVPQAAVDSVRAGADVVLFTDPTITADVIGALESAVGSGSLSPERVDAAASKVWRLLGHSTQLC